jgi:hypothetical protein
MSNDPRMQTSKQQGVGQSRSGMTGRFTPRPMGGDILPMFADPKKTGQHFVMNVLEKNAPSVAGLLKALTR